ncbi:hypothetical protein ACIFOE_04740 [Paenibacillus sp. NRS-1783]|uniref:hypothetical protein n=1 Tax=Paenibacillus sp. NRS-1783 TaxID=3233907 RepID=UPI003D292C64
MEFTVGELYALEMSLLYRIGEFEDRIKNFRGISLEKDKELLSDTVSALEKITGKTYESNTFLRPLSK